MKFNENDNENEKRYSNEEHFNDIGNRCHRRADILGMCREKDR